jgi:hypothetical protein
MFNVTPQRILNPHGFAHSVGRRPDTFNLATENQALDLVLNLVIQLVTIRAKEL